MAAQTEGKHAGEFILSEAPGNRSRENVIVLLAENLKAGHVLGRRLDSPTVAAAVALGVNTGDGAVSGEAVGTDLGVQRGRYTLMCIEPGANAGVFAVFDPNGVHIGDATVAVAFDKELQFTIADGANDFVAGDAFSIQVTGGTYKYKEYDPTDEDGGQRPSGILYDAVDATSADKDGVVVRRDAELRKDDLNWFTGATAAQKDEALDALEALGLIGRS